MIWHNNNVHGAGKRKMQVVCICITCLPAAAAIPSTDIIIFLYKNSNNSSNARCITSLIMQFQTIAKVLYRIHNNICRVPFYSRYNYIILLLLSDDYIRRQKRVWKIGIYLPIIIRCTCVSYFFWGEGVLNKNYVFK